MEELHFPGYLVIQGGMPNVQKPVLQPNADGEQGILFFSNVDAASYSLIALRHMYQARDGRAPLLNFCAIRSDLELGIWLDKGPERATLAWTAWNNNAPKDRFVKLPAEVSET